MYVFNILSPIANWLPGICGVKDFFFEGIFEHTVILSDYLL